MKAIRKIKQIVSGKQISLDLEISRSRGLEMLLHRMGPGGGVQGSHEGAWKSTRPVFPERPLLQEAFAGKWRGTLS